ncbi:MFS transporter [Micromonospora globbae]|jgi:MFS family permease|uniref:MFS transporter n=1 Tax=Micromonospora globbae TaxID=1894969 RepID=A0A420EVV5_9ACTN|nr:MFS transporter [Micromonospora globbae]RKF24829.1 MFS transporter [Micromonospora globbae]
MTDTDSRDTTASSAAPTAADATVVPQPLWRLSLWLTAEPVSLIGDQIFFLAIAWTAVQAAGPKGVGLVLAAGALPRALLMLFGGAIVDKLGPRRVALTSDILRALLMIAAAAIAAAAPHSIALLLALAVSFGIIDALFYPATGSLAPRVVPQQQLVRVQNIRALGTRMAVLFGAPLGGLLLAMGGPSLSFVANAATFVLSAAALAVLRVRSETSPHQVPESILRQVTDGLHYAVADPVARNLLLLVALLEFAVNGVINTAFPALAVDRGWGAQGLGWLVAVFGAGAAAAALVLIIVSRAPRPGLIVAGAALTGSAVMALFADAHSLYLTLSLSFAVGVVGGVVAGIVVPIIQTTTPENLLGRLMSLFGLATVGVAPLSIAAAALITEQAGLRTAFLFAATLTLIGAIACTASTYVRRIQLRPSS